MTSPTPLVTFHRAQSTSWNGNGFGTDSAKWIAVYNGETVGTWFHPASDPSFNDCTISGEHWSGWKLADWKRDIRAKFEVAVEPDYSD